MPARRPHTALLACLLAAAASACSPVGRDAATRERDEGSSNVVADTAVAAGAPSAEAASAAAPAAPAAPPSMSKGRPVTINGIAGTGPSSQLTYLEPGVRSVVPAMLVRTGEASVEVKSLDDAVALARQIALRAGGFLGDAQIRGGRDEPRTASIQLKVPSERFDDLLAGLSAVGRVERVNVDASDVGEEFADVQARATNAHRLEERLLDLLAHRTGTLQQMLEVERELARVREEIERMEGRMRYLQSRASVSTLTLALHEPILVTAAAGPSPIADAARDAWRNFVGFVAAFVASLGVLVPLGLIVAALAWMVRRSGLFNRPTPPAPQA